MNSNSRGRKKLLVGGCILIIDSDNLHRSSLIKAAAEEGFDALFTSDTTSGLRIFNEIHPDIVVIDIPSNKKASRIKFCRLIRGKYGKKKPYIIMMLTETNPSLKIEALKSGVNEFILRPVHPEEFKLRLTLINQSLRSIAESKEYTGLLEEALSTVKQYNVLFDEELTEAKTVQQAMLPNSKPFIYGWGINFFIEPAMKLCGDFIDLIECSPQRIGLVLIDVSGHGAPSALVAGMTHAWIRSNMKSYSSLIELTRELNSYILNHTIPEMYLTGFIGILDAASSNLEYILAGHPEPIIYENGKCQYTSATTTTVIGMHRDINPKINHIHLEPGMAILVYSDGVFSALSTEGKDEKHLLKLYESHNASKCRRNVRCCMADDILKDKKRPKDDIALLCITRFEEDTPSVDIQYKLVLPSEEGSLKKLQKFLIRNLKGYIEKSRFWDMCQVISELVYNAIEWGNRFDTHKKVLCYIGVTKYEIIVTIEDEGDGFDVKTMLRKAQNLTPEKTVSTLDKRPGRFGLAIATRLSDNLVFNEKGNRVETRFWRMQPYQH